jgi:hypothetical protein
MRMCWLPPAVFVIGLGLIAYGKGASDTRLMLIGGALGLIGALAWLISNVPD